MSTLALKLLAAILRRLIERDDLDKVAKPPGRTKYEALLIAKAEAEGEPRLAGQRR